MPNAALARSIAIDVCSRFDPDLRQSEKNISMVAEELIKAEMLGRRLAERLHVTVCKTSVLLNALKEGRV